MLWLLQSISQKLRFKASQETYRMSNSPVWAIEPHTIAKHEILKLYLDRWFPILGKYNSKITYIDGFAGPGLYAGGEKGSPIIAIESAMKHIKNMTISPSVKLNFYFVERDKNISMSNWNLLRYKRNSELR
jgi:three-Cys-motif partner protein